MAGNEWMREVSHFSRCFFGGADRENDCKPTTYKASLAQWCANCAQRECVNA
jgi:hypothetical protein